MSKEKQQHISITAWIFLFLLIVILSGVLHYAPVPWKAFDFANLVGNFGKIAGNITFVGKGDSGTDEALLFTLTLIPSVALAVGLLDVVEAKGGMQAAERLFRPILKPLMGIPGAAGISFVMSFTSTDATAVMTKQLYDDGLLNDDERAIYAAYQYAASAVVLNTMSTQAPLLPIITIAVGPIILLEIMLKVMGANIVRLIILLKSKRRGGI